MARAILSTMREEGERLPDFHLETVAVATPTRRASSCCGMARSLSQ